jgi:hypothetical protein
MNSPDVMKIVFQFVGYGKSRQENIFQFRSVCKEFRDTIDHFVHIPHYSKIRIGQFLNSKEHIKKQLNYDIQDCIEFVDNLYVCAIKNIHYKEYSRLNKIKNDVFFEKNELICPYYINDFKFKWLGVNI